MSAPESNPRFTTSNVTTALSAIVVAFTILTAWAAFLAGTANDTASAHILNGQRDLSDANVLQITAGQDFVLDSLSLDGWWLADVDSFEEEYYYDNLPPQLQQYLETETKSAEDAAIEAYFGDLYASADAAFESSAEFFTMAEAEGERALGYQRTMLTFAVGLSFAAWGTLADESHKIRTRITFSILSVIALVVGIVQFASV